MSAPGKVKYFSARGYVQADGSYRVVASVERFPPEGSPPDAPAVVTMEFGEVKDRAMEALADALDRAGMGGDE